jgi:phenylalanine-4-hydroxylase
MMKQNIENYTTEDQKVWKTLFDRQLINLQDKSCTEYLSCLKEMDPVLNSDSIPNFDNINNWFKNKTGWEIEVVPGLIPLEEFFELLANKRFCSSTWLRTMKQLDYLEEPDMFHDVFGHIPLLANPIFSEFAFEFGKLGMRAIGNQEKLEQLQRLYWFTIEFGLMKSKNGLRIYGAGLMSSYGESKSSLSADVTIIPFDIKLILNQDFRNDIPQNTYFSINSLDELYNSILSL